MPDCELCGKSTANPCPTCHHDKGRNVEWWELRAKRGKGAAWWHHGKVESYNVCDECGRKIGKAINEIQKEAGIYVL